MVLRGHGSQLGNAFVQVAQNFASGKLGCCILDKICTLPLAKIEVIDSAGVCDGSNHYSSLNVSGQYRFRGPKPKR